MERLNLDNPIQARFYRMGGEDTLILTNVLEEVPMNAALNPYRASGGFSYSTEVPPEFGGGVGILRGKTEIIKVVVATLKTVGHHEE